MSPPPTHGNFDYVVFMDSDLTNDPVYLEAFAARMDEGFDVIKASRYVPGGGVRGVPVWRVGVSVSATASLGYCFACPSATARTAFAPCALDCSGRSTFGRMDLP